MPTFPQNARSTYNYGSSSYMLEPYFEIKVFADATATGGSPDATISRLQAYKADYALSTPPKYTISSFYNDPATSGIDKGKYVQIFMGRGSYQQLRGAGYIASIDQNLSKSSVYDVTVDDASYFLNDYRCLDAMYMPYPKYNGLIDILQGPRRGHSNTTPDYMGLFPPGYDASWNSQYAKGYDSRGNLQFGHAQIPGSIQANGGKYGDYFYSALESSMFNLTTLAARYNCQWRSWPRQGRANTRYTGNIELGFFGEQSHGWTIWGGETLRNELTKLYGSHGNWSGRLARPNMSLAQQAGLSVIQTASFTDTIDQVINIVWCPGAGKVSDELTLRSYWPDEPNKCGTAHNWGNGRTYYTYGTYAHWMGSTYVLIASHRNVATGELGISATDVWEYGVADLTSISVYGPRETVLGHGNKKVSTESELLSSGVGTVDFNAQPQPSWQFVVLHPRLSPGGLPPFIREGATMDVRFQGEASQTTQNNQGQLVPTGSDFQYMKFPQPGDTNPSTGTAWGVQDLVKMRRCISVTEEYSGGVFTHTIATGRGKYRGRHFNETIAEKLEHVSGHNPPKYPGAQKNYFLNVHWLTTDSQTPGYGQSKFDHANKRFQLEPGSVVVSDVPDDRFFGDHNSLTFKCRVQGHEQTLDTWFCKYVYNARNPVTANYYAVFRLAMNGSGHQTGLYKTKDGVTMTKIGGVDGHAKKHQYWPSDSKHYKIRIDYDNGIYAVHITTPDNDHFTAHIFHDDPNNPQLQWLTTNGAIGWSLSGGTREGFVSEIHVHPYKHKSKAISGGRAKVNSARDSVADFVSVGGAVESLQVDESTGLSSLVSRFDIQGMILGGKLKTGSILPNNSTTNIPIVAGVTNQVTFSDSNGNPILLPKDTIKFGYPVEVLDDTQPVDRVIIVNVLKKGSTGEITGFISLSPFSYNHSSIPITLHWDSVPELTPGTGIHSRKKQLPAYNGDPNDTILSTIGLPNGSNLEIDQGSGLISVDGTPIYLPGQGIDKLAKLRIDGSEFQHGLERHGFIPFDDHNFYSSTQLLDYFPQGYVNISTPPYSVQAIAPDANMLTGNLNGQAYGMAWSGQAMDGMNGSGQRILCFKFTNSSGIANKRWYDTAIYDANGNVKTFAISKDISISTSVYVPLPTGAANYNPSGSTNTFMMGSHCKLLQSAPAFSVECQVDFNVDWIGSVIGDTWIIDYGKWNQEKFVINDIDTNRNSLIATDTFQYAHNVGANLCCKISSGTTIVDGLGLEGINTLADTYTGLSNLMIGIWDGLNWWRGWWGDPSWVWQNYSSSQGGPAWVSSYGPIAYGNVGDTSIITNFPGGTGSITVYQGQFLEVNGDLYEVSANTTASTGTSIPIYGNLINSYSGANINPNATPRYLGPLALNSGSWTDLHLKASDIRLFRENASRSIQGVEIGGCSYSATSGAPVYAYVDQIHVGHTTSKSRIPSSSISSNHLAPGAILAKHFATNSIILDNILISESSRANTGACVIAAAPVSSTTLGLSVQTGQVGAGVSWAVALGEGSSGMTNKGNYGQAFGPCPASLLGVATMPTSVFTTDNNYGLIINSIVITDTAPKLFAVTLIYQILTAPGAPANSTLKIWLKILGMNQAA